MSKHTPGPWAAEAVMGDYATDIVLDYRINGREFPIVVASVLGCDEGDFDTPEDVAESKANARLIAAAPDLLAACKTLLGMLEDAGAEKTLGCETARAAIAKATGVQP